MSLSKLLNDLKQCLIDAVNGDELKSEYAAGLYETFVQNEDHKFVRELIDLYEDNSRYLYFDRNNNAGYMYNIGGIQIEIADSYYQYEINLTEDERMHGYCLCDPQEPYYNFTHECCGMGCDAAFPQFTIIKSKSRSFSFKGFERDIWQLEAEWNGTAKADYEEQKRLENIKHIEEQIQQLNLARYNLISEGEMGQ